MTCNPEPALNRSVLTDRSGTYRLDNLAAGSAVIEVSYAGPDTKSASTVVEQGQTSRLNVDLTSTAYVLDHMVVAGEREGNAQAITLQRVSSGVKNIVAGTSLGSVISICAS